MTTTNINQFVKGRAVLFCLVIITLFGSMNMKANEGEQLLQKVRKNYEKVESFEMELTYSLFKGHAGNTPVETYKSTYNKTKESYYRNVLKNEFIDHPEYSILIDHANRQVLLSKPNLGASPIIDLKKVLSYCAKIETQQLENGLTQLQVEIKNNNDIPFSKIVYQIDKEHWIKEVTLYYVTETNFSGSYFEKDLALPKLKVEYKKLSNKWKDKEKRTELATYIQQETSIPKLEEKYKGYTLVDNRNK